MTDRDPEQKLRQWLRELPDECQPERDLWPGIEHALNSRQRASTSGARYAALAASVLLAAMLGWLSLYQWQESDQEPQLAALLTDQHRQQKNHLLAVYQDHLSLTDNWQQQLEELDQAASAIRQALEDDPRNMALLKMLRQVHQQQIDLIERVHAPGWQQIQRG